MANNVNTPSNNQEGQLDIFMKDENAKMNTFREFFSQYINTQIGSSFFDQMVIKYTVVALNTKGLFKAYFDSLKKTHPYTDPTNGAGLTDKSKNEIQKDITDRNKDEFESLIYSQYNLLLRQESHLKEKIERWYNHKIGAPGHLSQAAVNAEVNKLSLADINTALYSPSRLTNMVNAWHKALTRNDYSFQGYKKEMIDKIAAIAGTPPTDAHLIDIYNRITREENASIENLEKILGNIGGLSNQQKFDILEIIKPTITLGEYREVAAKHNGGELKDDDEIIESILSTHTIPGLTLEQKESLRARIVQTMKDSGNTIHVPLSWIRDRRRPDYLSLFDEFIKEAIGTMTDRQKRDNTLELFDQKEMGAKHSERDKDTVTLESELDSLRAQGKHDFERLKRAGIEAENHKGILDAFIKRLGVLRITGAEKIGNLTNNSNPSPLYIIYRLGGINQYIEIKSYNANATPIPTLRCINHTNVDGAYYKNDSEDDVPVDRIAVVLSRADRWEDEKNIHSKNDENGRVVEASYIRELIDKKTLTENIPEGKMEREHLEKKLFELDGEKDKLQAGLLIRTLDTEGKPMFVEVTNVDDVNKTVSINTVIDSVGTKKIAELKFHEFLRVFNQTQCRRVGRADSVKNLIELFKKTNRPSEFAHIDFIKDDNSLTYKNDKAKANYPVGGFRTPGNKGDHIFIESISDSGVTYIYVTEGELHKDDEGNETIKEAKSLRKFENVSLAFFADQLNFLHDGDWRTFKNEEKNQEAIKKQEEEDKKKRRHHHEHPPHYHGGPLQWLAHSKNIGHLFKGMGMAFGELKHFIEHGDEHVAKEMEYAFISWMRDTKGLSKFMPEEIYLDMKAEIESKKKETIDKLRDKWGGLSTADCGRMASALLDDKHTTTEQMFGIIFGLHKKVGNLYGIANLQSKRDQTHIEGIADPAPLFLYKLCIIQGDDPVKMINNLRKICGPGGERAMDGNRVPVPEMYLIQVYSQKYLQVKNPPPVPGSFHAKIAAAWPQGEQEQKKGANDGEANMYATQDQIESRMYILAGDGEAAQAVGFYERLIPRGAPMHTLMGLPFIIATSGLRDQMSNQLIREIHINGVYEQGFSSSILTALESQEKCDNFQKLLKALADKPYEVNGELLLPEAARDDLKKIFSNFKDIPEVGRKDQPNYQAGKQILKQRVEAAKNFWASYGKRLMRMLDATDDQLMLFQKQDIDGVSAHFKNTKERTEGRSFNANLTSWRNGHYDTDSTNYTILNPKEAASSFHGVNQLTGKFKSDDNGQMHEYIFMSFQKAFQRVKGIKDEKMRKDKFFEMHYEILKKIMGELNNNVIEELIRTNNYPSWYSMLRRTIGFNIKDYNSGEVNEYSGFDDINYRKKAEKEYNFLMSGGGVGSIVGNVSGNTGATINPGPAFSS